jgi:proline iminopeptidase
VRVDIGGGTRLFFDVAGSGLEPTPAELVERPTLLLLHGGPGGDHSSFRPYFDRFAETHQVVYLDQRGQGRSDGWEQPDGWNLDTWADDVVRFCDVVGIEHPVVLGLSFGGFVAIRYAARHPDHPAKLILSSTTARARTDLSEERFAELGGPEAVRTYRRVFVDGDHSIEAMIDYLTINMPLYNQVPSGFGPSRTLMNLAVFDHFTRTWGEMDLRDDVGRIETPTLVLGGRDDPMTPHECSTEIFDLLPEGVGRLEILDRCGHGTFRDQPEETEHLVRAFLAG